MLIFIQKTAVRSRFKVLNRGHWVELVVVDIRSLCHQQRKLLQSYRVSLWQLQSARNIPKHRGTCIMHQPISKGHMNVSVFVVNLKGLIHSEQGQGLEGDCRRDQHELTKNLSKGSLVAYQKCLESTTRFLTTMIVRLLWNYDSSICGLGLEGFGMQILENPFR